MGNSIFKKITILSVILILISSTIIPLIGSKSIEKLEIESKNGSNICDLLIIAPSEFVGSLKPLVAHKEKYGVRTSLVSLDYIYDMIFYGRDNAEKIKLFIKHAYDNSGIKYVMLVGGIKNQFIFRENYWLPVRYVYVEDWWSGSEGPLNEEQFLSDLYFADIYDSEGNFCSWDTDGDGKYGEWNNNNSAEDMMDFYPEVFVGRLACISVFQVKIMVKKIIDYEKVNNTGKEWFKTMMLVAGDTYAGNGIEGENETQQALDNMPGFNPVKLWHSQGTLNGPKDVINALNNGCGFLYFAGHGSPYCWGVYNQTTHKFINCLNVRQIPLVFNFKKLPICIIGGCHNSMFSTSFTNPKWDNKHIFECFGWRLNSNLFGGTIATIGNTGLGYGPGDKFDPSAGGANPPLINNFFSEIGMNNTDILGEAWGKAVCKFLDDYPINLNENSYNDTSIDAKTVLEWILLGDPSLKIGGYP